MRVQWIKARNICRLCESVNIRIGGFLYTIPRGFEWNGASIPAIFWSILRVTPFHHTVRRASLLHDFLYTRTIDRRLADTLFLILMREDGANIFQRAAMFMAVRLFGWLFYKGEEDGE